MGIAERRAREKGVLRTKILEAASQLFVEEGLANVSLRKIADRIEYSPATIYLYFEDKNHLFSSLCQETFALLREDLERIEAQESDALQALRLGLRFYIDFGLQHPNQYILSFGTPKAHMKEAEGTAEFHQTNQTGLETFDCLRRALERCRRAGQLVYDDLEATSQVVWTFIHGITSLLILYHDDPVFPWVERERLIERGLDMVLRSLRPG